MRTRVSIILPVLGFLFACSTPVVQSPSLAPRAGEDIDPRVAVVDPVRSGPVTPTLAAHLDALIDQANAGDAVFREAASNAERLAASAGAPHSESWVLAQQALSAAQAARGPTTRALGDIDWIASTTLQAKGGMPAADLEAIQKAGARVSQIDRAQAERLDALEARLRG